MSLTLDPATEQRIQRALAQGPYRDPAELINHALNLFEAQEEWLLRNREAINARLEESLAQVERGEVYAPEEARRLLAEARQARKDKSNLAR